MWAIHNIVGHPLMEILRIIGLRELGDWVHEVTLPKPQARFKAVCTEAVQYETEGLNFEWFGRQVVDLVDSGFFDCMRLRPLTSHEPWRVEGDITVCVELMMEDDMTFTLAANRGRADAYELRDLDLEEAVNVLEVVLSIDDLLPSYLSALGFSRA